MPIHAQISISCFLGNELFAQLERTCTLAVVPASGWQIAFPLDRALATEEEKWAYELCFRQSPDPSGVVFVETITYCIERVEGEDKLMISCRPIRGSVSAELINYIKLMTEYHGFLEERFD